MDNEQKTEVQKENENWPLWRAAVAELEKRSDFGFGMTIEAEWFERAFAYPRDSSGFAFALMDLRSYIEVEYGYYIQSQTILEDETGIRKEIFQVPSSAEHQDVYEKLKNRMYRFGHRAAHILHKTLANPKADLTAEQRTSMEKAAEIAAVRMILLRREKGCINYIKKKAPKLLR
jgi:hypothetical protein